MTTGLTCMSVVNVSITEHLRQLILQNCSLMLVENDYCEWAWTWVDRTLVTRKKILASSNSHFSIWCFRGRTEKDYSPTNHFKASTRLSARLRLPGIFPYFELSVVTTSKHLKILNWKFSSSFRFFLSRMPSERFFVHLTISLSFRLNRLQLFCTITLIEKYYQTFLSLILNSWLSVQFLI